ncbi:MAG TPA: hypothetical protein VK735_25065 [Pseudonocardia sp.]|uniref:hypothetical protein n=1 Tax=Pseudonocardia sp. TaxID=60912 RepID=UPI002BBF6C09|nr:hypothetical protein [Pseudonocardia sp.]HTF50726.1 hypothetical protein [Pseudonocardia sp.]
MSFDPAAFRALAAERSGVIGPCNKRCERRGRCAFGRADLAADPPCRWCRERRPPTRTEALAAHPSPAALD